MRAVRLPAMALVAVVLLAAIGDDASAGASASVTQRGDTGHGPATTQAFAAGPCPVAVPIPGAVEGQGYLCGSVTVPQRHTDPAGTQLQLAAIRILSPTEPREPDPVVFAQGGPGGSGLDFAAAAPVLVEAFAGRDLILFDQRGAGHSHPFLHCDEHDPVALAELTGQTSPADALDADVAAYQACAQRFAGAGYDLSAFNTLESAADVRDVVTALGYEDFDFYGVSYGTRIGQALLRDAPTGLRSAVLDSVVPTTVNTQAQRALTVYGAFQALFSACAEEGACSTAHPDLEGTLLDTAASLAASPVHIPVAHGDAALDVVVDGEGFLQSVAERFYTGADGVDEIPAFIQQAADGDLSAVGAALAADATATAMADGLYYAVHCTEDQPGAADYAFDGVPEQLRFLANRLGDRNTLLEICAAMGIADAGGTVRDAATSDIPVLTVSGEFDPVTPASYADRVRKTLSASYGLEFPGVGHGVLLSAGCPTQLVAGFIAAPTQEPDAACIADMPEFSTTTATPSADPSPTPDTSPAPDGTPRPGKSARPAKAPKARPVTVGLVKVAAGFENANGINNAGDKRLFVSEQEGYVEVLKPSKDGTFRDAGKFLDIRSRVVCCGEKGFLGIAFPPDYTETGYFYITFAGTGHTWNLEERRVSATDPDRADPNYKRRLIRVYKPLDFHWAGDMHFGADGYLYVTVGDGGFGGTTKDPGDPANRAQDLSVIFGKMLRIDPRGTRKPGDRYTVPASNPFVKVRGAQPEIWAYGLRNPWRWSFDRLTHDLWIGDVGMWSYEEVNRAEAPDAAKGDNFGWRRMEGPACYNPARHCDNGKLTLPFSWYAHQNGMCAVAGGYVYRGNQYPALRSWYVFGDYCSGRIMLLNSAGKTGQKPRLALDTKANISAFGEGADGELYMVDYGPTNTLYRVTGTAR
jgi:pimeloyl-ACP methyl ester carboxylesterase/glucose/arabinose dehydrogenase